MTLAPACAAPKRTDKADKGAPLMPRCHRRLWLRLQLRLRQRLWFLCFATTFFYLPASHIRVVSELWTCPSQEILHRRFQRKEQSDPNSVGYRFPHAERFLRRKRYRVCSTINCINHRPCRTCCSCRQIGNRWRPQSPQKPKQKLKLSALLYFVSLSDFGPPIWGRNASGLCGQIKNFSQLIKL